MERMFSIMMTVICLLGVLVLLSLSRLYVQV